MKNLNDARFILAILMEPSYFDKSDRAYPEYVAATHSEDRERHWRACLADSGIVNIQSVSLGSWSVSEVDLNDDDLEKLLRGYLAKRQAEMGDEEDDEDGDPAWHISCLYGGIHVLLGNEVIFEPQCCTDIGDWNVWPERLEQLENTTEMLWIGHPWIMCRRRGDEFQFTSYVETGENLKEEQFCYRMDRQALIIKVAEIEASVKRLHQRLFTILTKMGAPEPKTLADNICRVEYLDSPPNP